ncbi:MOSC domain-containing protein [Acidisoma sp. 7E03]
MHVDGLYHYPVKGLSAQALARVQLAPGEGFPFDRVYGLARHDSGYDPADYKPLPKTRFIVLVKEERLAELRTFVDPATRRLVIDLDGRRVLDAALETPDGQREIASFFAAMFDLTGQQTPVLAVGGENRFTDVSVDSPQMMNAISVINLQSVQAFAARIETPLNPLRFRANLYIDGLEAFSELDMVGQEVTVGSARLKILQRTRRCAATDVDPDTAQRNTTIPRSLMKCYGHADMGVYAEVIAGGVVEIGSPVSLS